MTPRAQRGRDVMAHAGRSWGYATNAHPSETLDELLQSLALHAGAVRRALDPDAPLGIELRLGAPGIEELAGSSRRRADLARALEREQLHAFSCNGFPLSRFTAGEVKTGVYVPDWTSYEREQLTIALAEALLEVTSADPLTISTLGGAYRPRVSGAAAEAAMRASIGRVAVAFAELRERHDRRVVLALEPEPFTTLETAADAARFHSALLSSADPDPIREHVALNYDLCHQSVVFETPSATLATWAEIPIAKVHVSAALRLSGLDTARQGALAHYDEPRYLHQSFRRDLAGRVTAHPDLGLALADLASRPPAPADELRVHFHVPLHAAPRDPLESTADDAARAIGLLVARTPPVPHWVVETYTWDVLRDHALVDPGPAVAAGIARELEWMLERVADATP